MPSLRNCSRGNDEKAWRRVLRDYGKSAEEIAPRFRIMKMAPELRSCRNAVARITSPIGKSPASELRSCQNAVARIATPLGKSPILTKFLLNVTIGGCIWPVQVLISTEATVADLVTTSLQQYLKELRQPILPSTDPANFNLHYSQLSLESLERGEKLGALGSRNLFICPKKNTAEIKTSFLPRESIVKSIFGCAR